MRNLTFVSVLLSTSLDIPYSSSGQTPAPTRAPPQTPVTGAASQPPAADRPVSWKLLLPNIRNDQEQIWTFPVKVVQGQNLLPTAAVLGTAAGLVALDPTESSYFHRASAFHGFNAIFAGNATAVGTIAAPISLYVAGLIRKDSKMQRTALLAGEAVADSELVTTFLKDATRRVRPAAIPTKGNYSDSWFERGGSLFRGSGSFPSGHTIAAVSVATIMSRR